MKKLILVFVVCLIGTLSFGQRYYTKTQADDRYVTKADSIDPETVFYTKAQVLSKIDSVLNARFGNLELSGSKLTYTVSSKTYTAQTDSTDVSAYGSELVSNGAFANGTGWDNSEGFVTFTGGVAAINTGTTTYENITFQAISIQNTKTYKIEFDVTAYTAGELKVGLGSMTQGVFSDVITATGHYSFNLTLNNALAPLTVRAIVMDAAFVGSIDNLSVKEVL